MCIRDSDLGDAAASRCGSEVGAVSYTHLDVYKRQAIRFKVRPDGRLMDGSMVLEGRSGDTSLDRAAWGAITGSSYPPLPADFKGPFLELRAYFLYNMEPRHEGGSG